MTYYVHTTSPLADISLRFCSCCLKKFCPRPDKIKGSKARFFVPTIDALFREHFAYIEAPKSLIEFIYEREEKCSLDLLDRAKVLHVEKGSFPDEERAEEIVSFYRDASIGLSEIAGNRLVE